MSEFSERVARERVEARAEHDMQRAMQREQIIQQLVSERVGAIERAANAALPALVAKDQVKRLEGAKGRSEVAGLAYKVGLAMFNVRQDILVDVDDGVRQRVEEEEASAREAGERRSWRYEDAVVELRDIPF